VYAIDIKRCPHCISGLDALPVEHADGFAAPGPAVVCRRCDDAPAGEQTLFALFVPSSWD
jgi:hypothetical protein